MANHLRERRRLRGSIPIVRLSSLSIRTLDPKTPAASANQQRCGQTLYLTITYCSRPNLFGCWPSRRKCASWRNNEHRTERLHYPTVSSPGAHKVMRWLYGVDHAWSSERFSAIGVCDKRFFCVETTTLGCLFGWMYGNSTCQNLNTTNLKNRRSSFGQRSCHQLRQTSPLKFYRVYEKNSSRRCFNK